MAAHTRNVPNFNGLNGSDIIFHASSIKRISCVPLQCSQNLCVSCSCSHLAHKPLFSIHHRINHTFLYRKHNVFKISPLSLFSVGCGEGFCFPIYRHIRKVKFRIRSSLDVANAVDVINDLGLDTLTFLAVTVLVVPAFKKIKASPILGFFFAGIVLNQLGLIRNLIDVKILSEWGILFLVSSIVFFHLLFLTLAIGLKLSRWLV